MPEAPARALLLAIERDPKRMRALLAAADANGKVNCNAPGGQAHCFESKADAGLPLISSLMIAPFRDPAENDGLLRHFYRDWRPTRFARIHNAVWAWASGLGLLPPIVLTLQTRNRSSGNLISTILAPVDHNGKRYLVSMLGHGSQWVQNARESGGDAFIKRGRTRRVSLVEIPIAERAPILKAWCQVATSGRRHLPVPYDAPVAAFEAIAQNYPVFRIDPAKGSRRD